MQLKTLSRLCIACALTITAVLALSALGIAQAYQQTNLVSDVQGLAQNPANGQPDLQLVNPWGITSSATSSWWVSDTSQAQHANGSGNLVGTAAGTDAASQVMIDNFVYSPVPLTVKVGTTVTWINHDDIPHTVDSTEGKFKSAALDTNDHFDFRFSEAGEYPFYCRIHPRMTGKIIVQSQ